MIEFKRILCPVDCSDLSTRALHYAAAFARWYDGELIALHVLPSAADLFAWTPDAASQMAPMLSPARAAHAVRQQLETAGIAGLEPRIVVHEGLEHEAIAALARDEHVDLLVIGTHGRRGFNRLFLGSVTEKVIRTAPCPVLTVPPGAPDASGPPVAFKRILCPLDYSASSTRALRYALELGRQGGGTVTVLHVCEYKDPKEPSAYADPAVRAFRQRMIADAHERLHHEVEGEPQTWCGIEEIVALNTNRAAYEILDRSVAMDADLIVMGAQGSGGLELMLYGSNTHHAVRRARCPVLTVRA